MLSLQRPNSAMEQDFHALSPGGYDHDRRGRVWGDQVPYSAPYPQDATTQLPPIQTARNPYEQSSTSYDPVRRPPPLPTTVGQSYSPYSTQPPQSPYGHPSYAHNPHLYGQTTPQMSPMAQQFPASASTYSPIRPMPALASGQPHNMSSPYGTTGSYNFPPSDESAEPQPRIHVVGSQGRRGVLPSDEGKPPAIINGAAGKTQIIPQKDADGKFPCPHCQKTYLHGKHLKRHLLRHTGDRPYSCFLCNDTFSRSDILKRHFQKCSQRRGNPTGASHLAYSHNHLRRQAAKAKQNPQAAQPGVVQPPPINSDGNLPSVTQAGLNHNTTGLYTDSNHYGDSRTGGIVSPGLNKSNHGYISGQAGQTSLPSSGSSTPLTAKTLNGQFPTTYQTEATHRSTYPEISNRNQLPQIPGGSHFEGNAFEWSNAAANPHGKDSSAFQRYT